MPATTYSTDSHELARFGGRSPECSEACKHAFTIEVYRAAYTQMEHLAAYMAFFPRIYADKCGACVMDQTSHKLFEGGIPRQNKNLSGKT
ncbi:MAG: hypothetical protein DRP59_12775 [Spirochaetes bacterium]|nr:MAG: hypothetical protein DRP59_12775 [Spirochaetota bacterium]